MKKKMDVLSDFLTGSYSRSTMIAPLKEADIDIFFVLDPKYYSDNGQAALLDKVKGVLKETYPKTPEISRNGQAVTIRFSDFVVDVVPGFYRTGGGSLIPTTYNEGSWIATDPREHVKISSTRNAANSSLLVPMVKMIKCWNRTINHHFHSFHLEVLAWDIFQLGGMSGDASSVLKYFDSGRTKIKQRNEDPAGYGGDVGYYISTSTQIEAAASRFETAYGRASKAVDFGEAGKYDLAIAEWQKIFGSTFPSS